MSSKTNLGSNFEVAMAILADAPEKIEEINKILEQEIILPNTPFPVVKKFFLWDTICECKGWCLQQNEFTRHCRIVDPNGIRRAWGTKKGMIKALKAIINPPSI